VQVNIKPVASFLCYFIGVEPPSDLDKNPKYRLLFATPCIVNGSDGIKQPQSVADFFGASFKSKVTKEELVKLQPLLQRGKLYSIRAAIDSYAISNEKTGAVNQGIWFEILNVEPAEVAADTGELQPAL
jgi:hypothetical protein